MADKEDKSNRTYADPKTGEVIVFKAPVAITPPKRNTLTDINKVAGKNPAAINLRDHPEFAGMELIVADVRLTSGEISGHKTNYAIIACFLVTPGKEPTKDDFRMLITGADNVYDRVVEAVLANALPISGTLRHSGRAWFLD